MAGVRKKGGHSRRPGLSRRGRRARLLGRLDVCRKTLVDERQNTSSGNGSLDEGIQLFVTADSELEMARSYTLDSEIF